jgi:hypothetical protein
VRCFAQSGALQRIHVCREHRLYTTSFKGSVGPESSVVAAVLFNFGAPPANKRKQCHRRFYAHITGYLEYKL